MEGCAYHYRSQVASSGGKHKALVQLHITEKVTKAWRNKTTCRETRARVAKVFDLLFILRSGGEAGWLEEGFSHPAWWPRS